MYLKEPIYCPAAMLFFNGALPWPRASVPAHDAIERVPLHVPQDCSACPSTLPMILGSN